MLLRRGGSPAVGGVRTGGGWLSLRSGCTVAAVAQRPRRALASQPGGGSAGAKALVVAEHSVESTVHPATLHTIGAASRLGGEVHVFLAGKDTRGAASAAARVKNVARVLAASAAALEHPLAERLAPLLASTVRAQGFTHVLAPATSFGKNLLPRLAAELDVAPISEVIEIKAPDTFRRPIYAGNAVATVKSRDTIKLLTVRATAFPKAELGSTATAPVEEVKLIDLGDLGSGSEFVSASAKKSERPELTSARVVISGGRGMQSAENFKLLDKLADKLGAAVGASRAAVDAGYAPNELQVGQTGKIVAPELYIAVGISGAIQHLAGMKDSKVIVAINKDAEAPIFAVSDYGYVGDLFKAVPELEQELEKKAA